MAYRRVKRTWPLALAGALLSFSMLLAACGTAAPGVGSGPGQKGTATVAPEAAVVCTAQMSVSGVDVVNTVLTCTVTNASTSDTSFALDYSVASSTGGKHVFAPACIGELRSGKGVCSRRYSAPVPLAVGKGSVSGKTAPGSWPLGPVSPREITAPGAPTPPPSGTPITGPIGTVTP